MNTLVTSTIIYITHIGAGLIDGIVISRYLGSDAMAASGIAHPIFSIIAIISGLFATGMQIKCSNEIGKGNVIEANRFFRTTIFVAVVVAIISTVLALAFVNPMAVFLGAKGKADSLANLVSKYLTGVCSGIPAMVLTAILAPALQLDNGRKLIQIGAIIECVSDIILDILAIYVGGGIMAVGFATSIASYLFLFYICIHFLKKERVFHLRGDMVSCKEFFSMISQGTESVMRRTANVLRPIFLNRIIIMYGGTTAMFALSVKNNLTSFTATLGTGTAITTALIVGLFYGEINKEAIKHIEIYGHKVLFGLTGALCLIIFALSKPIAKFYVGDESSMVALVVFSLFMLAIDIPINAVLMCRISYLQSVKRMKSMTILTFISVFISVVVCAYVLGKLFGVYGILASSTVSDFLCIFGIYAYHAIRNRTPRVTTDMLLVLPNEFDIENGDIISAEIKDKEDITKLISCYEEFCIGHNVAETQQIKSGLAIELICDNIVEYGFAANKDGDRYVDVRIVYYDNKIRIRIYDNGPHFDLTKHLANVEPSNENYIVFKILDKVSENIKYINSLELNIVILEYESS